MLSLSRKNIVLCAVGLLGLISAGCLISYQYGQEVALSKTEQQNNDDQIAAITKYYPVEDLVTRLHGLGPINWEPEFDTLIELLKTKVTPDQWNDILEIHPLHANRIIAVTQTKEAHAEIAKLLDEVRKPAVYLTECQKRNRCPHCQATPLSKVGTPCSKCKMIYYKPTFGSPQAVVLK